MRTRIANVFLFLALCHFGVRSADTKAGETQDNKVARLSKMLRSQEPEVQRGAAVELAEAGKPAIPALLEALGDKDARVRGQAAYAFSQMGEKAVPAMARLIKTVEEDPDSIVRGNAAYALGCIGPRAKAAVPALIKEAQKDSLNAVEALGQMGDAGEEAVPVLVKQLKNEDEILRYTAAAALGWIGAKAKASVSKLARAASEDKTPRVRLESVLALAKIGPEAKAAVPTLVGILEKEDRISPTPANSFLAGLDIGAVTGLALARIDPSNKALAPNGFSACSA